MSAKVSLNTSFTFDSVRSDMPAADLSALNAWLTATGQPTVAAGQANPAFQRLLNLSFSQCVMKRAAQLDQFATFNPVVDIDLFQIDFADMVAALNGDIEGWQLYMQFTVEAELDNPVPETFPNRVTTDVDGNEQVLTMRQWGRSNPRDWPIEQNPVNGFWYRATNNGMQGGTPLTLQQLQGLKNGSYPNTSLLTTRDYNNLPRS